MEKAMIHCYKLGGMNIVLDVFSGSVHVVDDVAFDLINLYENTPRDEMIAQVAEKYADRNDVTAVDISECLEQIEKLKACGKLFTDDVFYDKADVLKKIGRASCRERV